MEEIVCSKCNSKYKLIKHKIRFKDKDDDVCCVKCGNILHSGKKECAWYEAKLISD